MCLFMLSSVLFLRQENLKITQSLLYTLNHPTQDKHATFHSMINRFIDLTLNQTDYNTEVNIIKYSAQEMATTRTH